jgi:hypothetical protein
MPLPSRVAVKCLDTLFRFELAAAEACRVVAARPASSTFADELLMIAAGHSASANRLRAWLDEHGEPAPDRLGLWAALPALAAGSADGLGVLAAGVGHGLRTYQAAVRLTGLPPDIRALVGNGLLPPLFGRAARLHRLAAEAAG